MKFEKTQEYKTFSFDVTCHEWGPRRNCNLECDRDLHERPLRNLLFKGNSPKCFSTAEKKKKKNLVKLVGFGKSSPKKKKKMSLFGKVEADVEIKAPAEKFHELFSCRPHHISNVSPGKVQGCALHEGDWGKEGSVIFWDYVHGKAIPDHILYVYMTMYYYVFTCLIKLHTQYTRNMV